MIPSVLAFAAASRRVATLSFWKILLRCCLTVPGAIKSFCAISLLLSRWASRATTSNSRLDNGSMTSPSFHASVSPERFTVASGNIPADRSILKAANSFPIYFTPAFRCASRVNKSAISGPRSRNGRTKPPGSAIIIARSSADNAAVSSPWALQRRACSASTSMMNRVL